MGRTVVTATRARVAWLRRMLERMTVPVAAPMVARIPIGSGASRGISMASTSTLALIEEPWEVR